MLFRSNNQLLVISTKVKRRMKKTSKVASQTLAGSVLLNLHVLVVWDTGRRNGSPFSTDRRTTLVQPGSSPSHEEREEVTRSVFALLCQACAVVDHYPPWHQQDLSDIALRWWQERSPSSWQHWTSSGMGLTLRYCTHRPSQLCAATHSTWCTDIEQCTHAVMQYAVCIGIPACVHSHVGV